VSGFNAAVGDFAKSYHQRHGRLPSGFKSPDNTGEPPGGDDMLAVRVQRLEEDMKEARSDLKIIRSDLAELKGKVGMLPGWGGLLVIAGVIIGAVGLMLRFMPPAGTP